MVEGLVGDKRRQATDSIRGYVYQAYQSVLAWMRLGSDEVLFLEGAEDFDVHSADGVTATQVKDTAGSGALTLRCSTKFWLEKALTVWREPLLAEQEGSHQHAQTNGNLRSGFS
jgi:hypothetical protein